LNPTSFHLLNASTIALMRRTAVLINTARGPIIDEAALVSALETGAIAGAALDVFEDEPLPMTSPLRAMKNVWLAPHNSNSSPAAWESVHESTIRNLFDVLGVGAAATV
jgi:D-3-phosphoglycerate dehydrogenase